MECPVCKNKIMRKDAWSCELGGTEEYITKCEICERYIDHWSYGRQYFKIGNWEAEFVSHGYLTGEDAEIAEKYHSEFDMRVRYYKQRKVK